MNSFKKKKNERESNIPQLSSLYIFSKKMIFKDTIVIEKMNCRPR